MRSLGSLAQSVEHRTFNAMVPRSSRGRPTNKNKRLGLCPSRFFLPTVFCVDLHASIPVARFSKSCPAMVFAS